MGHAFQQTLMDILIRFNRMEEHNTLWQTGTDHAGIATQMVVERKIAAEEGKLAMITGVKPSLIKFGIGKPIQVAQLANKCAV